MALCGRAGSLDHLVIFVDFGEAWSHTATAKTAFNYIALNFIPHTISPFQAHNLAALPPETHPLPPRLSPLSGPAWSRPPRFLSPWLVADLHAWPAAPR